MNRNFTPSRLLPLLLATVPCAAQDRIAVLEGATANALDLRIYDEAAPTNASAVWMTQLEILPIEFTNRTAQGAFRPGHIRLVDRAGWRHVALPGGGRLFKYRRSAATRYGFFVITASGAPVLIQELSGVGIGGIDDPYEARIGVAGDGRHAALATVAGGFYIALLDGSSFASTNAPVRPITVPAQTEVEPLGVAVGATHLFFLTGDDHIHRCALADGNQPADVTPATTGSVRMKPELAPSGDGSAVAFLLGPKDTYTIYLLRTTGSAVALAPPPSKYEEPGYLPDVVGGPRMLLNDDGTRLMYTDAVSRDEIYLLDTTGQTGVTHVTSDANFLPYIGVGILPAFAASTLVLAVGDPQAFDWFRASTASQSVTNLTGTGPRTVAPFAPGLLVPSSAFLGGDGALLATEETGPGRYHLQRTEIATGRSTLLREGLTALPEMGEALGGSATVLLRGAGGDAILGTNPSAAMLIGPPGVVLSNEVVGSAGFGVLTAQDATTPGPVLPVIHLHGVGLVPLPPIQSLTQVVLTRSGGGLLNGRSLEYFAPGRQATLGGPAAFRVVVSGVTQ
ncbi:MAG: hypothetical protein KDC87_09125 [Planctomycetes bacterium]|nr:hypothetical protein [Planctomycetota bacterium]MCB9868915.1 hypothetical protein [Planctomycetota bacterium]